MISLVLDIEDFLWTGNLVSPCGDTELGLFSGHDLHSPMHIAHTHGEILYGVFCTE